MYEYWGGWVDFAEWTFQWVCLQSRPIPCYIRPYEETNVPVGIDGLEFA